MEQPILIVGTGAMASLFAGRLAEAGIPVLLLGAWKAALQHIAEKGVTIVEPDGREHSGVVKIADQPAACAGSKFALVLVKSWQTERAAQQLVDCLDAEGVALTLQNGLGNRETLVKSLGAARVALGVTTLGANLLGPGRVRAGGEGVITLGVHARLKPLADLLRTAGFIVESAPDPNILLWAKLVINSAINPLTALLRVPNGELLEHPSLRALLAAVARESAAVAVARGIHLPYPDPVVAAEAIARNTARNISSMLQDVQRGAPTEIDAINGAIVQAGEQTGVPAPINRTLWQLLKGIEEATSQ
jgi:2-dehydropantoate 2-reductase